MKSRSGLHRSFPKWLPTALTLLFLVSCSTPKTRVDGQQYMVVEKPSDNKKITLLLASYNQCDNTPENCQKIKKTFQALLEKFESCVASGLAKTAPQVTLIKQSEWQPNSDFQALTQQLITGQQVATEKLSSITDALGLDYLVSIGVTSKSHERQAYAEASSDGLWAFGEGWQKSADITTTIFTADNGEIAGELSARLTKDAFWMMPVFIIIPMIPIGWSPNVEQTSCRDMGKALGRFLSGAGNNYVEQR